MYRYQVNSKTLPDILNADFNALKSINQVKTKKFKCKVKYMINLFSQPKDVNDQLHQLYLDLEHEGFSAKLSLESTSGSSGDDENDLRKKCNKKFKYSKLVLIYEENCPLPSN